MVIGTPPAGGTVDGTNPSSCRSAGNGTGIGDRDGSSGSGTVPDMGDIEPSAATTRMAPGGTAPIEYATMRVSLQLPGATKAPAKENCIRAMHQSRRAHVSTGNLAAF